MEKYNKNLIVYEEDEELLLVNMKDNKFYALDKVSTIIWNEITSCNDIEEISARLSLKFEVDKEIIRKDVVSFTQSLKERGIIL